MSEILIPGGSGGVSSDDVTVVKAHVLKGETALTSDSNGEIVEGEMTVNSLLSFSCAAYSGRRVLAMWQNPRAAIGKPYSGVYIRYSTGGYPGKTGGTQIYKGTGNNMASEGQSQAYIDLPTLNTTYYLSCYPYVTCSATELTGDIINSSVATLNQLNTTIKGTQIYTIPYGYTKADIFCVGGGGNGATCCGEGIQGYPSVGGAGGGGGYTTTKKGVTITPGTQYACTIGGAGAATKFGTLLTANGGGHASSTSGKYNNTQISGAGGSGGGGAAYYLGTTLPGAGGSDGSNGANGTYSGGKGQGNTTRAYGNTSGTLYAGGGGCGNGYGRHGSDSEGHYWAGKNRSNGGSGGGGAGGINGGANTGGGGGGQNRPIEQSYWPSMPSIGVGGSGVILLRLY